MQVVEKSLGRRNSTKRFSDNFIFFMEKYSSGERADRRRWRMKEGERVAAVKIWRSEQRATNFGHRNRVEETTPIAKLSCKSFSDNFIFFMEKYSSGRRGVTRKQTDLVTVYFPKPAASLAFTELERRESKRLVCSFLSKFRKLNIWRSTQVVEEA